MWETQRCLKHEEVSYRYVTEVRDNIQWVYPVSETTVASLSPEAIRAQLQRILDSPVFSGARRISEFLQFVVSRSIDGQAGEIKEYLIAVEVYNRNRSYDPRSDSIVRAEASRLRGKLRDYYSADGSNDPIRIELPKGSYTPVFRLNSATTVPAPNRSPAIFPVAQVRWRWPVAA